MNRFLLGAALLVATGADAQKPLARSVAKTRPPASLTAKPSDSLVVTTEWLASRLQDPNVIVVQMMMYDTAYRTPRIPGAKPLRVQDIIATVDGVEWELPPVPVLDSVFESVGVSDNRRVVLYGAPMAVGRAFMTLELLGHRKVSVLDGGLEKWQQEGRPMTSEWTGAARAQFTPRVREDVRVDRHWVKQQLETPEVVLLDTRTLEEFEGRGMRHGTAVDGHLPGARHLVWQSLFRSPSHLLLKDRAELDSALVVRGAQPNKLLVTYCAVGARASISYFVARYLGYDVRLYDGSYMEWAHAGMPVVK